MRTKNIVFAIIWLIIFVASFTALGITNDTKYTTLCFLSALGIFNNLPFENWTY